MSTHVSTNMWGERDHNEIRRDLIREMNRLGAVRLEGEYSGGHDEGGLDWLAAFDAEGERIPAENLGADHKLYGVVDNLLSTKFYSWALESSVYGKVYVDLRSKRAWTEGHEETIEYREDSDPIDWRW